MKRSTLGSLTLFIFAVLVVLLIPFKSYGVTTTFTVTIPNRPAGQLPVALVKVELIVPGADAMSTLTMSTTAGGGFTSAALTPSGFPQPLNGRNKVTFQVNAVTDKVTINFFPYENLQATGAMMTETNRCALAASPIFPYVWTFTFDGPAVASSYQFTSYTALSEFNCGCDKRRLGNLNNPATISMQVGVPPGKRFPIDLILVLDRSGSMSWVMPGTADIRLPALKWAIGQLIAAYRMENGPDEDRLAVVWFESGVSVEAPGFVTRLAPMGWENLSTAINAQVTGNNTNMGGGVSRAMEIYRASLAAGEANRDAFIILVTDGMQNVGNNIKPGNETPVVGIEPTTMAFFNENLGQYETLHQRCIPVQSIGVGAFAGSEWLNDLTQISEETGGKLIDDGMGGLTAINLGHAMDIAMKDAMIESMKGNTLSKIIEVDAALAAGAPSSAPAPFELSSSVKRAIVILGWRNPASGLELQINPPGGGPPIVPAERRDDPFYTVQAIDIPASGLPGQWTATVRRTGSNTVATPYHLSVLAVEGRFSFQTSFKQINHGTGEPIVLNAAFGDNGIPITGLGNAITVRVERPQSAIGTFLHNTNVSSSVLTTNPPGRHPDLFTNPYARKVFNLMNDPNFLDLVRPRTDPRTFTLFDDGNPNNGDAVTGDGVYSMKLSGDDTKIPGLYRFTLKMDFDRPTTGRITRTEEVETQVTVKVADPNETEIAATKSLGTSGEFRVDVVPADRFKNFMGPGFAGDVKLTVSGGGSVAGPPVDERENGTYTFRIVGVPSGADPTVTLIVNDLTVRSGTLSQFSKPSKRFAIFGGIGGNFPHGDFNTFFNSGVSTQLGFEYRFTNRVSAEGTFGFDRFPVAFFPAHVDVYRLSANVKFYPVIGTFQFGVFGGGGVYHFNPSATRGGLNIGAVGEYRINTSWSVESTYNFHNVFTSGSNTRFSTLQGGVRFRF